MTKDKKKLFSRPKIFFYVLSVCIFVFIAFYFTEIKKDIKLFGKVNVYWLGLAIFGQVGTYFWGAIIYRQLLRLFHIKLRLTIWTLFQTSIITLFFNQTVPSAGVSGNTFFFNFLKKRKIMVDDILSLIFIELLTFYAAMETIIIFLVVLNFFLIKIAVFFFILGCGFLVYLLFGLAIGLLGRRHSINLIYKKIKSARLFNKLLSWLRKPFPTNTSLDNVKSPGRFFRQNKTGTLMAVILQLCIFISDVFTIFCLFKGLDIPVTILQIAMGLILTKIISILPFLPGALILYEGSMTFFFSRMGINLGTAVVVTLLYRALSFWLPILLGFFLYRKVQVKEK